MSLPIAARNRAIVKKTLATLFVSDIAVPKLRDGYTLVKTAVVALNPAD
jgi:NADPH:quinone reductase-like Zn-dependent oxidoreductase